MSTRFLEGVIAGIIVAAVAIVLIVAYFDKSTTNAASVVSATLSPVSAIVGLVVGHHLGSRRR